MCCYCFTWLIRKELIKFISKNISPILIRIDFLDAFRIRFFTRSQKLIYLYIAVVIIFAPMIQQRNFYGKSMVDEPGIW